MTTPLFLGLEIGGTKLQLGLGRGDGALVGLQRRRVEPERGAEGIRAQVVEATAALLGRHGVMASDLAALGIGFGGPVDAERGVVTVSNQIEGWAGFPIADWVRQTMGIARVVLQNDADSASLGEARFGAGVGVSPVLYVTIGSGIGGGLVVDGSLYRGNGRGAMEIGHLLVDDHSLEQRASGWSIAQEARRRYLDVPGPLHRLCEADPARITAQLVARAAAEGDGTALAILGSAHVAMGKALAHAVTLLAPRRVILGGGVSLIGEDHWFAPIRRETDARVFPPFRGSYDIVPAALGEEVVVHGALAFALDASRGP
jgi:glucokinase